MITGIHHGWTISVMKAHVLSRFPNCLNDSCHKDWIKITRGQPVPLQSFDVVMKELERIDGYRYIIRPTSDSLNPFQTKLIEATKSRKSSIRLDQDNTAPLTDPGSTGSMSSLATISLSTSLSSTTPLSGTESSNSSNLSISLISSSTSASVSSLSSSTSLVSISSLISSSSSSSASGSGFDDLITSRSGSHASISSGSSSIPTIASTVGSRSNTGKERRIKRLTKTIKHLQKKLRAAESDDDSLGIRTATATITEMKQCPCGKYHSWPPESCHSNPQNHSNHRLGDHGRDHSPDRSHSRE